MSIPLKSYKSYSKLEPNYYCTGHTNGDTSMSLVKGGHINSITVQGQNHQTNHNYGILKMLVHSLLINQI